MSVTQNILDIVLQHAQGAQAKKVTNIYLVIGDLSTIVDDSVQFYWDIISKDTIAEGAILQFKRITTQFECLDCHTQYQPNGDSILCPNCGSMRVKVLSGEEFYLEAIDVEK
ncbi:MAG: hydrogenase maturation nickel metallochaperone HypA [Anaerolineales bacterium]